MKSRFFLLAMAFMTGFFALNASQGPDWAQYGRYRQANADLRGHHPRAVLMGNSITDNWAAMMPSFFADNDYAGRGISGQTSAEMLARFRQDVLNLHPQAVAVMAGTNDVAGNNGDIDNVNIVENIQSMCELARANGIVPLVCSVPPSRRFGWRPDLDPSGRIRQLNDLLRAMAREQGYPYVDYYSSLADDLGGLPEALSADGCHPLEAGYLIMQPILVEAVDRALQAPQNPVPTK